MSAGNAKRLNNLLNLEYSVEAENEFIINTQVVDR
jgi:hypothetical protein